jgi:hypothetical protein
MIATLLIVVIDLRLSRTETLDPSPCGKIAEINKPIELATSWRADREKRT